MPDLNPTEHHLDASAPHSIGFWQAFQFWLKLGFISFGGPAGQIAIMHQELVEKRKWISEKRFLHALNFCMVLPGPEAQQLATYLGWLMHRTLGGVVAGVLFVLPSFIILIGLSTLYMLYGDVSFVSGLLEGLKPAVSAIVFQAAYRIGLKTLKNAVLLSIAFISFILIHFYSTPFPLIVVVAATVGALGGHFYPRYFSSGSHHQNSTKSHDRALIHDDSPVPEHAQISQSRIIKTLITGLILWLAPIALMFIYLGQEHILTQMAWFFTKAALLTFGGAYAVLPYVYDGAVSTFNWITPSQMLDGLALGETTPGPLIIVITYVGFIGGFVKSFLGPELQWLSGFLAATVVTWFTFLPSFIFIFLGGPLIEASHQELKLTAPLTAMTAAIVGVILNLAVFLGMHVLLPQGMDVSINPMNFVIFFASLFALIVFKQSVIRVILAAAAVGCAYSQLLA